MKKMISIFLIMLLVFAPVIQAAELIVKVDDEAYSTTGKWNASGLKGFDGTASVNTTEFGASATYRSPLKKAGNAKVEFYNIAENSAPGAKIVITYDNDKTFTYTFDQGKTAVGWLDLGIFTFQGTANEGLTVVKDYAGGYLRANVVRFTETTEATTISPLATSAAATSTPVAQPTAKPQTSTDDSVGMVVKIDDTGYTTTGAWSPSGLTGYNDTASAYTTETGGSATFCSPLKKAGNAKVEFYNITDNTSAGAKIVITYNKDKTFSYPFDQNKVPTGWVDLGVFTFQGTAEEGLTLTKEVSGGYTRSNAVRFTETTEAPRTIPTPTPIPTINPESSDGDDDISNIRLEGYSEPSGKWTTSGLFGFRSSGSRYAGDIGDSAKWDPGITTSNTVKIFIYKIINANNVTNALYQVHHSGQVTDVRVNLKDGVTGWYELGTFDFNGKGEEFVTVTKDEATQGEGYIRSDAVKFIAVSNDKDINNYYKQVIIVDNDPPVYFFDVEFDDTASHWAKEQIAIMANRGLVKGVDENNFNPDGQISRAEFATLLTRILKIEEIPDLATFSDSNGWYQGYIGAAQSMDLFVNLPVSDNQILPDQPITRQEMALLISNAGKAKNKPLLAPKSVKSTANFGDGSSIFDWAKSACQYVIDNKIITGYEDNTFRPENNATRAEATVMLKRFKELVLSAGPQDDSHEWVLTFEDNFDGTELDWNVWVSENRENKWPAIKSSRYPENIEVKDGYLYMHTKKNNPDPSNEWSTAYIWTKDFTQKFGYFEARYKYCAATGINNAFWLMTNGTTNGKNPGEHEIDINEGHYPNKSSHNFHGYDNIKKDRVDTGYKVESTENYGRDFHIFACEWNPTEIIFYVDGKEVHRKDITTTAAVETESVVRFSTAVGEFAGWISDEMDGTAMIVDYVRVYQRKDNYGN